MRHWNISRDIKQGVKISWSKGIENIRSLLSCHCGITLEIPLFKCVHNFLSNHFLIMVFKTLSDNSKVYNTLSIDYFFHSVEIFLIVAVTSNFLFKSEHFSHMSLFKPFIF